MEAWDIPSVFHGLQKLSSEKALEDIAELTLRDELYYDFLFVILWLTKKKFQGLRVPCKLGCCVDLKSVFPVIWL